MSGKYTVISTFAGGGGSSLGYKMAGFKELLAIDFDKNACETLKLNFNFPVWEKDITQITGKEILDFCNIKKKELDILDGSPPCQGFSTAGKRKINDPRNKLFKSYIKLINELQPKIFVMENVTGMIKGKMKGMFNIILNELKNTGYNVKCKLMNSMWYDVPQSRERLIFIGVRKDLKIKPSFPKPSKKYITVKEILKNIKPDYYLIPRSYMKWTKILKQGQTVSDIHPKGFGFNMRRLKWNIPAYTITKTHTPAVGLIHPLENRFIAINELLKLSTFPLTYKYIKKDTIDNTIRTIWAIIGNSVMPNMMKAIALNVKKNILDKIKD